MRVRRSAIVVSGIVAIALTADVTSRIYDRMHPAPYGLRSLYASLPTRVLSRAWGSVAQTHLPRPLLVPVLHSYSWLYGVNLDEMDRADLGSFSSIQDFFTRSLKAGVRPVAPAGIACPVDGRVMTCGPVNRETGLLASVKVMFVLFLNFCLFIVIFIGLYIQNE
jgi:hypothetical protein